MSQRLVEATVTSLSWIPSEAVRGPTRVVFDMGAMHYDQVPPERIDDLPALREGARFRFANVLEGRAIFEEGRLLRAERSGGCVPGITPLNLGPIQLRLSGMRLPDITPEPEVGEGWVRFTQTAGARIAIKTPRLSSDRRLTIEPPLVWTTLSLTLHADGRIEYDLVGASPFPRHWVYGPEGGLALKAGLTEFGRWMAQRSAEETPWGASDSPVIVTAAESAIERVLSRTIMGGASRPMFRSLAEGETLFRQGEAGQSLALLLDGVLEVLVDGVSVGQVGPGAVLGERALLEEGLRTATLLALTPIRVAEVAADGIDPAALLELVGQHARERDDPPRQGG